MDNQDQRKSRTTGHENHGGVHVCHKCGWPFPNPHPSAKHRRAHKKICGTIEGYKLVAADAETSHVQDSDGEHHSDEDLQKMPSPRALQSSNSQKPIGGVGERLKSVDEVFADAVAEFSDGGGTSGAEENVRNNLEPVAVKYESTHSPEMEGFGGGVVAGTSLMERNSSDHNKMQDPQSPETTSILKSNPELHDHMSSQTVISTISAPDCKTQEPGVMLHDNKSGLPSNTHANKVEGTIDGLHEGVSTDTDNGMKDLSCSSPEDDADNSHRNIPLVEAPVEAFEEASKLDMNYMSYSETEKPRDFVSKEEVSALGHLGLLQNAYSLDVGPIQQTSIPENDSQVDHGLHNLQEGEKIDENSYRVSVPDDISIKANPASLLEDYKDHKGVKLQISSTLQLPETIKNDEDDLKDVASVERFIILQSESLSMASKVPHGESSFADDSAMQRSDSYKLMVKEEPKQQEIEMPLDEAKIKVNQSSDEIGASQVDFRPETDGQKGLFSKENESDDFCKDSGVSSSDCPVSASNVIPAYISTSSADHDKDTGVDDKHNDVTEESDFTTSTFQSNSKLSLLQSELPASIVDCEVNSDYENLETESHDAVEFHFREVSMESEGNLRETNQTAGLICDDHTHLVEGINTDGVDVDGTDKVKADKESCDDKIEATSLQPSESLPQSQGKPLINRAQSTTALLGKNTLLFESASSSEIGNESVKNSQGILCTKSPAMSGSEQETKKYDTDIIDIVQVEYANTAVDFQTDYVKQDKEMEDPIKKDSLSSPLDFHHSVKSDKDNQTEDFRGEAVGLLSASLQDGGSGLAKQQSGLPGIDGSVGIDSRSDSLECNWGSVSVLSMQSETLPSADSHGSTDGNSNFKSDTAYDFQQSEKSEVSEPPSFNTLVEPGNVGQKNDAASEDQTGQNLQCSDSTPLQAGWFPSLPQVSNESPGRKKNEEIIAKVTNWSTGMQHAPLKSLLSEAAQDIKPKSPTTKENPNLENQKNEKAAKDNGAKMTTVNSILGPESAADPIAKKEMAEEWNSPARYPAGIQREKRKVKGKPFWTQFMCCTSVKSQ